MTEQEIKEAKELLENSLKGHNDECIFCAVKDTRTKEALALLSKQPCKTCKGSGKVPNDGDTSGIWVGAEHLPLTKRCPDCKGTGKQPSPTADKPKCKTCGGSGFIYPLQLNKGRGEEGFVEKHKRPCPDCSPTAQAPTGQAGEFIETTRERLKTWRLFRHRDIVDKLAEACDLLFSKQLPPTAQAPTEQVEEFIKRARLIATHEPSKPRTTMEKCILEACGLLNWSEEKLEFEIARFKMMRTALIKKQEALDQSEAESKEVRAELEWWHNLIDRHHDNEKCPSLKAYIENLEAENKELKQADKTHLSARRGLEKRYSELEAEKKRLKEALQWCSGSADFAPKGKARTGWEKICQPLLHDQVLKGKTNDKDR